MKKSMSRALGSGYAIRINGDPQFASITLNGKEIVQAKLDPLAAFYCWKHQEAAELRDENAKLTAERDLWQKSEGELESLLNQIDADCMKALNRDKAEEYANQSVLEIAGEYRKLREERDALALAVADAEVALDYMSYYVWNHKYEAKGAAALERFRNRNKKQENK